MGKNFRETLNKQLVANEKFREEFEALAPEYEITKMLIESRKSRNLTQKQLAEMTGINQADISKIEHGTANPSVKTLMRLAAAMNMRLKIEFIPEN